VKTATDDPWQEGRCVSNPWRVHGHALTCEIRRRFRRPPRLVL